jgi:hypothetical protein
MTPRQPRHAYRDPLDQVWLAVAARMGLRVERTAAAYAATDGQGVLAIGAGDLDADDCLAQMIFHEICHSLVQGEDSFQRADWGLDNETDRDVPREHACLRVQAVLAGQLGLRRLLAPTTDFRPFYDALPPDPLAPREHPEVILAIAGLQRSEKPPWAPHLADALAATAAIAAQAAAFAAPETLWSLADRAPARHPLGFPAHAEAADPARSCATCAWHYRGGPGKPVDRCRQADGARVRPQWPACARWEAALDCTRCGACCRAAYHSVQVSARDPAVATHPEMIVDRGEYLELRRSGDRCAALTGDLATRFHCTIYADRPQTCRDFELGGDHCLTARRRVGLSL